MWHNSNRKEFKKNYRLKHEEKFSTSSRRFPEKTLMNFEQQQQPPDQMPEGCGTTTENGHYRATKVAFDSASFICLPGRKRMLTDVILSAVHSASVSVPVQLNVN